MAWSLSFEACTSCGTTDRPHRAKGLCRRCYGAQPEYAARHNERNRHRRNTDEFRSRLRSEYRNNPLRCEQIKQAVWVANMRRRAVEQGVVVGEVTASGLLSRVAYYGEKCWMCGSPWEHMDHVKPLSKGGAHILANLRPACASCNSSKHSRWDGITTALELVAV